MSLGVLLSKEKFDYVSKKDGEQKKGFVVSFALKPKVREEGFEGLSVMADQVIYEKEYPEMCELIRTLSPGDCCDVDIDVNRYNRKVICSLELVSQGLIDFTII